jgi:hypothetical protein
LLVGNRDGLTASLRCAGRGLMLRPPAIRPPNTVQNLDLLIAAGLLYLVLPVWMLAGFADFACHRVMRIENSAGVRESLLHLLMLGELGIAILAPLLFEPTAAVLVLMLAASLAHEVTTCVDLAYAQARRPIPWFEQWVHGLQQALPWAWMTGWALLAAPQALALLGLGEVPPDWRLQLNSPLPVTYLLLVVAGSLLLVWGPFLYECWRCLQARPTAAVAAGLEPGRSGLR